MCACVRAVCVFFSLESFIFSYMLAIFKSMIWGGVVRVRGVGGERWKGIIARTRGAKKSRSSVNKYNLLIYIAYLVAAWRGSQRGRAYRGIYSVFIRTFLRIGGGGVAGQGVGNGKMVLMRNGERG